MPSRPKREIAITLRRVSMLVLFIGAFAVACGTSSQADTPFIPIPTESPTIEPILTPLPAQTLKATPTSDSPPRASAVTLANGRTAPILRNGPRDFIPAVFDPVHIAANKVEDQVGKFSPVDLPQ